MGDKATPFNILLVEVLSTSPGPTHKKTGPRRS